MREKILSVTLADCRVDTYRCGGNGGQNVNTRETGVRITHTDSGAIGQSCDQRTQWQNKKIAWRRMCETKEFKLWLRRKTGQIDVIRSEMERRVKNQVERDMRPENILVEYYPQGD